MSCHRAVSGEHRKPCSNFWRNYKTCKLSVNSAPFFFLISWHFHQHTWGGACHEKCQRRRQTELTHRATSRDSLRSLVLFSQKTQCFEVLKCQQDRVAAMYKSKLKTICRWQEMIKFHRTQRRRSVGTWRCCQPQFTLTLNLWLNLTWL